MVEFWSKELKRFVSLDAQGLYVNFSNGHIYTRDGSMNVTDRYIRRQCTGLRDKNGALVFDGDFVQLSNGEVCLIEYNRNDFGCVLYVKTGGVGYVGLPFLNGYKNFEVIGNRWENPELLESE
jgi:uncharacterized phage protein (TIGR01671 family)